AIQLGKMKARIGGRDAAGKHAASDQEEMRGVRIEPRRENRVGNGQSASSRLLQQIAVQRASSATRSSSFANTVASSLAARPVAFAL
ncbi:MAG: hypothetical protein QOF36_1877, partial [Microbacteriaceae bacterium]|nr:hypothetical protein [Microbacteriaceae bacterium]